VSYNPFGKEYLILLIQYKNISHRCDAILQRFESCD